MGTQTETRVIQVKMKHTRETKNTHRYESDGEDVGLDVIYVAKHLLSKPRPEHIVVTVDIAP